MIEASFWRERPVFVTGATGLLGGWLVKELLALQARVTLLRREQNVHSLLEAEDLLRATTVVTGDLSDRNLLHKAFADQAVDTVFHLASQPLVREARRDPAGTFEVNIAGTWNVLEAARQAATPRVIMASTATVYGAAVQLPNREDYPTGGQSPYDVSKRCAEMITGCYAATYGMSVAMTRCSNLFGGGDFNFSRMIPGVIRATQGGERFVIRSDGKFVRDYLYVRDAVRGYLLLAQRLAEDPSLSGEVFNFSQGSRSSVIDLVTQILALMDRSDLEPVIRNEASAEVREQWVSSEKARARLGWQPQHSLSEALRETIDWYVAHHLENQLSTAGGRPA